MQVFLDYIELWLSALGLVLIGAIPYLFAPPGAAWKTATLTAASVSAVHGVIFWIVRRRREKTRKLRRLTRRVQSARETERARIAREVHDVLGQALTGLQFDVVWLAGQLGEERFQQKLGEMESLVEGLIQNVQGIAAELRPGVLDELGITAALEWQTRAFTERTNLRTEFSSEQEDTSGQKGPIALGQGRATAVFRVAQEALTNASRHAKADAVNVRLTESGGDLVLTVEDDGRGITAAQAEAPSALGILGMRERAAEWGGKLRVEQRAPGLEEEESGTRVTLRLPLRGSGDNDLQERRPEDPKKPNDL